MTDARRELRILLVEDNEDDVVHLQDIFEESDRVRDLAVVQDGEAAIAYLERKPPYEQARRPDLVMLDLGLPKVDGFGVLDAMRSNSALREIPVVVFTQSRKEEDAIQSYDLGACSCVSKPVDRDRFAELVHGFSIYWDAVTETAME